MAGTFTHCEHLRQIAKNNANICGNQPKCTDIKGNLRKIVESTEICKNQRKLVNNCGNFWKLMEIYGNMRTFAEIYGN